MTLDEVEREIYDYYQGRTAEVIRVLGREAYLRNPVKIQEVGTLEQLWYLHSFLVEDAVSEMTSEEAAAEFGWVQ